MPSSSTSSSPITASSCTSRRGTSSRRPRTRSTTTRRTSAGRSTSSLAARASKVDRVVYTSSASVYGNPRSIPINEDDPLWTLSPYAVSKLGGENYCTAFSESYGAAASRRSATRTSTARASGRTTRTAASSRSSWSSPRRPAALGPRRRRADARLHLHRRRRRGDADSRRSIRAPRARSSTSAPASRRRSTGWPRRSARRSASRSTCSHVDRRDIDNIRRRVVNIEKIRRMLRWTPQWTLERGLSRPPTGTRHRRTPASGPSTRRSARGGDGGRGPRRRRPRRRRPRRLPLSLAFADAGLRVGIYDTNQATLERIAARRDAVPRDRCRRAPAQGAVDRAPRASASTAR